MKDNIRGILYIEKIVFEEIKNFKYKLKPDYRYVKNQKMLAKFIANKIQDEYNKRNSFINLKVEKYMKDIKRIVLDYKKKLDCGKKK